MCVISPRRRGGAKVTQGFDNTLIADKRVSFIAVFQSAFSLLKLAHLKWRHALTDEARRATAKDLTNVKSDSFIGTV